MSHKSQGIFDLLCNTGNDISSAPPSRTGLGVVDGANAGSESGAGGS